MTTDSKNETPKPVGSGDWLGSVVLIVEARVPAEEISATIAYEFADAMLEARKK